MIMSPGGRGARGSVREKERGEVPVSACMLPKQPHASCTCWPAIEEREIVWLIHQPYDAPCYGAPHALACKHYQVVVWQALGPLPQVVHLQAMMRTLQL